MTVTGATICIARPGSPPHSRGSTGYRGLPPSPQPKSGSPTEAGRMTEDASDRCLQPTCSVFKDAARPADPRLSRTTEVVRSPSRRFDSTPERASSPRLVPTVPPKGGFPFPVSRRSRFRFSMHRPTPKSVLVVLGFRPGTCTVNRHVRCDERTHRRARSPTPLYDRSRFGPPNDTFPEGFVPAGLTESREPPRLPNNPTTPSRPWSPLGTGREREILSGCRTAEVSSSTLIRR